MSKKHRKHGRKLGNKAKAKAFAQVLTGAYGLMERKPKGTAPKFVADPAKVPFEPQLTTAREKMLTYVDRSGATRFFSRQPHLKKIFKTARVA